MLPEAVPVAEPDPVLCVLLTCTVYHTTIKCSFLRRRMFVVA